MTPPLAPTKLERAGRPAGALSPPRRWRASSSCCPPRRRTAARRSASGRAGRPGAIPRPSQMLNTGAGKQLYRSMAARSPAVMPATSSACRAAMTDGRAGRQVGPLHQRALAQVGVAGQEHPAVLGHAQPRAAAATDMSSTAAPWLTFSRATMYRVYGSAIGRFWRGRGDQLGGVALDRRGGVRVGRRHPGERREQGAHGGGVLVPALLEPGAAGVVDQRVLGRARRRARARQVCRDQMPRSP